MELMKQFRLLLLACSLVVGLTSCGGGGGGGSAPPPATSTSSTISGQAVKGPLKKGATVTAVRLTPPGTTATTQVTDDSGKYSLTVPWTGPTEITISGPYTDEFTGLPSTDTASLSAVGNIQANRTTPIYVNLATTLVAKLFDAAIQPDKNPADVMEAQDAIAGEIIAALLGTTSIPSNLSGIDISQPGPAAAQLLAFQLIVAAAIPPGSSINQVMPQFVQNIHANRPFTNPVAGINGVSLADLFAAMGQLKTGAALTLKRTGVPIPINQIMANLASGAGVKGTIADLAIQINGSKVATITISPATMLVAPGQSKSFNANAKDVQGKTVPKTAVLWFSSDPSIATVDANGKLTGLVPGSVTVTASNGSITSNAAAVTVVSGAMTSIQVAFESAIIQVGEQEQFTAAAKDGANNTLAGVDFTWASSDPTVASIDTAGLVTANKVGTTTITASNGALTSPGAVLTVVLPPPVPPTFSFFNPPGGLSGALITIVGTNFGPTPADNTVAFVGGVATVNSASAKKLVVTVPPGAKSGLITVTTGGGSVTSSDNFNASVTNPGLPTQSNAINIGSRPEGIAITRDGTRVFAMNALSTSLSVITTSNDKVVNTFTLPSVSSAFASAVPTLDGTRVYVSLADHLGVLDATQSAPIVQTVPCCANPVQLAISPDGARLYVADGASQLVVIDIATNTVLKGYDLPGGQGAFGVAAHPDGRRVYVTNQNTDTLFVVDTTQDTVTPISLAVPGGPSAPRGIAIRPDGLVAYISLFKGNAVAVIDLPSTSVSAILPLPAHNAGNANAKKPNGIAISPDGKRVYVALTCEVISASCPQLIDTGGLSAIDVTISPPTIADINIQNSNATEAVVFTPDGSHAYVTAERSNNSDRVFRLP